MFVLLSNILFGNGGGGNGGALNGVECRPTNDIAVSTQKHKLHSHNTRVTAIFIEHTHKRRRRVNEIRATENLLLNKSFVFVVISEHLLNPITMLISYTFENKFVICYLLNERHNTHIVGMWWAQEEIERKCEQENTERTSVYYVFCFKWLVDFLNFAWLWPSSMSVAIPLGSCVRSRQQATKWRKK